LRSLRLLVAKEFDELMASRAYWLLLLVIGPLVGHGFVTAVDLYADASGRCGGPAALAQGLSPLDGILVPTFGAYDLAVTLLFPFVAIRLVSVEKESGALKLMLQSPAGVSVVLAAKMLTLIAGWLIAWMPGVIALALWKAYGGSLYAPEVLNLLSGHLLRVILSAGVAIAAAAIANGAATAAIATLAFTVGTWALDFVAMARGGVLQQLASYTPSAALRVFEQGELRVSIVLVSLAIGLGGLTIAGVWLPMRRILRSRLTGSLGVLLLVTAAALCASMARATWDMSENRRNSFPPPAEAALREIRQPLRVTVFLAAEDPRLTDLDRSILNKLKRVLRHVDVDYAARSRAGLFETGDHYGEVWYELDGRKVMSRSTTESIVLEALFKLAQVPPPPRSGGNEYAGHPLAAKPKAAAWIYYALWPLMIAAWWRWRFRYSG
jgi:ABC-type transport system involved in multi-copper enzyme maturation permease subunit